VIDLAAVRRRRDQIFLRSLLAAERELVAQIMRDNPGVSAADVVRYLVHGVT
jgi:hypothetical protein